MTQPVWVLSVDLQTKTATFQSGMADAAKSARGAFSEIKSGSGEMSGAMGGNMMEARHSVMMLGEEFGIRLPRALTSFIASLGPIQGALTAAFPFLAIAVGATILIEHLTKMKEAEEKLTRDQENFGTVSQNVFNGLEEKLLQAGIKADDLNHNHLAALSKQLKLIDMQGFSELVHSFEELDKASAESLTDMASHWYALGSGSDGQKHALAEFRSEYANLMALQQGEKASGLLHGTLDQAQKILGFLQQAKADMAESGGGGQKGDYAGFEAAKNGLRKLGVELENGTTAELQKQITAQQRLVDLLNAQVHAESMVADLNKKEKTNVHTQDTQADAKDAKEKARAEAEALREGRAMLMAGLYQEYKEQVEIVDEGEREKLATTKQGTGARYRAILESITEENLAGLQGTQFYKELLVEKAKAEEEFDEQRKKLAQEANSEDIRQEEAMANLKLTAEKTAATAQLSSFRSTVEQRIALERKTADEEYEIKKRALTREIQALDQSGADYNNKLKLLQDQQRQLTQQHENELARIRETAEQQTNDKLIASYGKFTDAISSDLSKVIMGHQTMAKMVDSLGDQMIGQLIQNGIKYAMENKFRQESDAKAAATAAYNWGTPIGGPILGAVLGAAAFAGALAFETGGIVPGYGTGDTVPAMLTPGETVLPKGLSEGLMNAARAGDMGNGGTHYHIGSPQFSPTVHALDADGVDEILEKHADKFHKAFETTLRKINR